VSDNLELVSCGIRYVNNIRAKEWNTDDLYTSSSHTYTLTLVALVFPSFGSYGDGHFVAQRRTPGGQEWRR
jgi:hypothetical protein